MFPPIAGYKVTRLLQRGGMADVYLAIQVSLGRPVAVKVLDLERTPADETVTRFEHEARMIARLDHPRIVQIFDVGRTDDGRLFYTMPYLASGDLDARSFDEAGIAAVVRDLCAALGYAHARGIVHRDVKPGNVLFDRSGRPLLADFGIALNTRDDARVTREGLTLGSGGYMSPEQARGLPLDGRADLYSLGVMTFELLAGALPYSGGDTLAMALAHVERPIPRLPAAWRHWQPFIDRALAKRPEDRYQSAEAMAAALDDVLDAPPPALLTSRRGGMAVAATVLLAIGGLTVATLRAHGGHATDAPASSAPAAAAMPASIDTPPVADAAPASTPIAAAAALITMTPAANAAADSTASPPLASTTDAAQRSDSAPARPAQRLASLARPASRLNAGASLRDRGGPDMAFVPAATAGAPGFALERTEVTRGDYAAFIAATHHVSDGCRQPAQPLSRLRSLNWHDPGFEQTDTHPVVCVSWRDANAYASWLSAQTHASYRLPTRAEWLRAAQYSSKDSAACAQGNLTGHRRLPFGARETCNNGYAQTAPVGHFEANALGVYDLVGNASEWTSTCAGGGDASNCRTHLYAGTSWHDDAASNTLAAAEDAYNDVGYTTVGFRLVRDVDSVPDRALAQGRGR